MALGFRGFNRHKGGGIKASKVTYICNGTTYTEKIPIGENAANPSGFVFPVEGATFNGWTDTQGSLTPIATIPATGQPMTLYAIWKWDDKAEPITTASRGYSAWAFPDAGYWDGDVTAMDIDMSKYSQAKATVYIGMQIQFLWGSTYLYMSCGGASYTLSHLYVDNSGAHNHYGYVYPTINFTQDTGMTKANIWTRYENYCQCEGSWTVSSITLTGRTVCG